MPKKNTFQLSNPYIEGSISTVFDAKEPVDAARQMWETLSEHIVQHVPTMLFTMQNVSSKKYHNFEVSENPESGKFTINELDMEFEKKNIDDFTKKVDIYISSRETKEKEMLGGGKKKRYDDSSSSSLSSSTDIYPTIRKTSPVAFYHYTTQIYPSNRQFYQSTLNPQIVAVQTPTFTPIFKPVLGTFVGIWP